MRTITINHYKVELNTLFNLLLIYYWSMLYFNGIFDSGHPVIYLMNIFPALFFLLFSFFYINKSKIRLDVFLYGIFILYCNFKLLLMFDFRSAMSTTLLGLTIMIIIHFDLKPSLLLVNRLFILSVLLSIPLFIFNISQYGFLPGQGQVHNLEVLAGRVSLFPNITSSLFLSLIIFIYNLFFNKSKNKLFFLILSFYYIFYGVSRTGILLLLLSIIFYYLFKFKELKRDFFYSIFVPGCFVVFLSISVFFLDDIISYIIRGNLSFLQKYFLRDHTDSAKILKDFARIDIYKVHLKGFCDNLLGLGSRYGSYIKMNNLESAGSESFVTRILATFGVGSAFFYTGILYTGYRSLLTQNHYGYYFTYIFIFLGLLYGSFYAPYNFIFLLLISANNIGENLYEP